MKHSKYLIILLLVGLLLFPAVIWAKVPERKEEIVYGLNLWDGKTYTNTFCPENVNRIYIIAGNPSVFSVRKTEVYYWPITKEYKANWFKKNELLKGTLEILKDDEVLEELNLVKYSFSYTETDKMILYTGKNAEEAYKEFEEKRDKYYDAIKKYYEKMEEYREKVSEIIKLKDEGEEISEEDIPEEPQKPEPFTGIVTKPQESFVINLETGEYKIRFKDEKGEVIPGTEKRLFVFNKRRTGIVYQVLPEEKWTYPKVSNELEDIIYIEGKQVAFFKSFDSAEYPEKGYTKLSNLYRPETDNLSEDRWRWIHLARRNKGTLQLLKDGEVVEEIKEKPYNVQQSPGYALGYEIVEWDSDLDRPPTFRGYKVNINVNGKYKVRMLDKNGKALPGSVREIRPIKKENTAWLFIISLIPFVIGLVIVFWRKSK